MSNRVRRPPFKSRDFFQKTLDSLLTHIAVLKDDGTIVAVNAAWTEFARRNAISEDLFGPGTNYLDACDRARGEFSEEASAAGEGIRNVLAGRSLDFDLEYPCHSPTERRWFSMRVTRFEIDGETHVVVCHDNITRRKLVEIQVIAANRSLEFQASSDGLTGIPNRRAFDQTINAEWIKHTQTQSPLSLAFLDVDCFKQYNDREGHLAGDDCLRSVAQAIASSLRAGEDFAARYGGEEFVVILPQAGQKRAVEVLGNIQRGIRALAIPHPSSEVTRGIVTISVGLVTTVPSDKSSISHLLAQADKALYRAKSLGRDQLMLAPP